MKIQLVARRSLPPLIPLVLGGVCLEFVVQKGWIPSFILPAPSEVFRSIIEDRAEFWEALVSTGESALLGLSLSFICGILIATLLSVSEWTRRAFFPYAIFFQTVPIISIAPLLVIWFGFGQPTVVASAFVVSIFPVIANTLTGLMSTDPALVDLFDLYSASRIHQLRKLRLPFAAPMILSGLRIASGLAVIGAVVGEFIAGGGLGAVVDAARTQQRIDKVFAAVLITSLLGLILLALVNLVSWFTLRNWHASAHN